jgi:hypothetical protein
LINLITPPAELVAFVLQRLCYGSGMKKAIPLIIFGLLLLVVLVLVNSNPSTPAPTTTGSTASSTSPATSSVDSLYTSEWPEYDYEIFNSAVVFDYNIDSKKPGRVRSHKIPSTPPQLAAYLTKQPDWNPTREVPGMYRVEDNVPTLSNPNVTPYTTLMNTGYILLTGNPWYRCLIPDCISLTEDNIMDYDELIIFDYEGNILHKFHTEEGFTFIDTYDPDYGYGDPLGMYYLLQKFNYTPVLKISISDRSIVENTGARYFYTLDLLTGEIK